MSETCQRCSARAHNAFLCADCIRELDGLLDGLWRGQLLESGHYAKGWLEYLEDAAWGDTRLGISVRRSTEHAGPLPFAAKASNLLLQANNTLSRIIQDNCESRGLEIPFDGGRLAFEGFRQRKPHPVSRDQQEEE